MHQPRKRFGQHFLSDQCVISSIVDALNPQPNECLVEIGPGQGAITLPVIKRTKHLIAIELDRNLIQTLKERCDAFGILTVINQDVLKVNFVKLKKNDTKIRLFGNLPYNISTPLLFHLLDYAGDIQDMVFMLQKEVAHRIAASPKHPDYGRLSVMMQYHYEVSLLFDVAPEAFFPPPKVDSTVLRLKPFKVLPYPVYDYALFKDIVRHAFGQRRKTLRNSLKHYVTAEKWQALPFSSDSRPEELSVENFVTLANSLR